MRFQYSITSPEHDQDDAMPRLSVTLRSGNRQIQAIALVDSGATINVLPFELGRQLGAVWDDSEAILPLGGILGSDGISLNIETQVGDYPSVELSFAWVQNDRVPLILGQFDFFENFRVCFERYNLEFEITPKPKA